MPSVTETIRKAIATAGESRYAIAKATGITQATLSNFMLGKRGLSDVAINALAAYFKLELKPAKPAKPGKTAPKAAKPNRKRA